eukprot:sb/3466345/
MFELLSVTTVTEAISLWKAVSVHGPPRRTSSIPSHPRLIHLSVGPWEQQKRRRVTSGPQLTPLICRNCGGLSGLCACDRTTLSQSAPTRRRSRRRSMIEVLRPTAIGRLEELNVPENSNSDISEAGNVTKNYRKYVTHYSHARLYIVGTGMGMGGGWRPSSSSFGEGISPPSSSELSSSASVPSSEPSSEPSSVEYSEPSSEPSSVEYSDPSSDPSSVEYSVAPSSVEYSGEVTTSCSLVYWEPVCVTRCGSVAGVLLISASVGSGASVIRELLRLPPRLGPPLFLSSLGPPFFLSSLGPFLSCFPAPLSSGRPLGPPPRLAAITRNKTQSRIVKRNISIVDVK